MPLFLFKPHVEGLDGQVTSPDVIVDRVFLEATEKPVARLTSEIAQQVERTDTARVAYALTAIGGGTLISPAILLSSGAMVIARRAWRLKHVDDHLASVTLNGTPLDAMGPPEQLIQSAGGGSGVLPRGIMVLHPDGTGEHAELHDAVLERRLAHRVALEPVGRDRWQQETPDPRYSIGPTRKEIRHYI